MGFRRRMLPLAFGKMIRRRFLTLALALPALAACSDNHGRSSDGSAPILRVGMDLTYPPFEMQDSGGRPAGVSVRMAEALAEHLGRRLQIVPMDFSGLIPALQTGNIDLVLSSMTATDERRRTIDFSDPYAFTGLALLVARDSEIRSVDDLKGPGRSVTAKLGTTGESWAMANLPGARRVVFEDPTACVLEVIQGRADAFIYDQLSIYNYGRSNPDTTVALLEPFVEEAWAVGLAKGSDELREAVNEFLASFRERDGFEKLGGQYLADEKRFLESQGIPFILR
jgi:polar amino acid transport system substrate-binding protein